MHNRKNFLVYPPEYVPGESPKYRSYKSLGKAKKAAIKWGKGAEIIVSIQSHPGKFQHWNSSSSKYICEVVR